MKEKLTELIAAAENNDADAQNEVYGIVTDDDLSESDRQQVVEWLQRSAKQGNAESMFWIGYYYKKYFGFAESEKSAFCWFAKSANAGYSGAFYFTRAVL